MSASTGKLLPAGGNKVLLAIFLLAALGLAYGSWTSTDFWSTPEQRGDRLMRQQRFGEAGQVYRDPWRIGTARYRNGEFEAAAASFARVPGASGAFNRGNALLMHGAYEDAIASYQRALETRPGWREAEDNLALARARKQVIDAAGNNRDQASDAIFDADEIVFDQKGEKGQSETLDMNEQALSDEGLRATWLRRVQTTPGDFLRAKFAYQAAHAGQPEAGGEGNQ